MLNLIYVFEPQAGSEPSRNADPSGALGCSKTVYKPVSGEGRGGDLDQFVGEHLRVKPCITADLVARTR